MGHQEQGWLGGSEIFELLARKNSLLTREYNGWTHLIGLMLKALQS